MGVENNAYIFGWNRPVTGREGVAAELFATTSAYFDKCQKSGKLESWEPVFLRAHGGDMNGFFFLRGTHANLEWVGNDTEFQEILMRAQHCLENVGFIPAYRGNVIQDAMALWTKAIPR
jgi:hypothetical protein